MATVERVKDKLAQLEAGLPEGVEIVPVYDRSTLIANAIEVLRDPSHVRDHRVSEWEAMFSAAGLTPVLHQRWGLELDFDSWVERIGTPDPEISALRRLMDRSPVEVREALAIGRPGPYDFSMPVALLQGS